VAQIYLFAVISTQERIVRVHRKVLSGSTFNANFEIRLTCRCSAVPDLSDLYSQDATFISFEFGKFDLSVIRPYIKQTRKYVSDVDFPVNICMEGEFINAVHDHYSAMRTPAAFIQNIVEILTRSFELFHSRRPSNWPIAVWNPN